MRAYRVIKLGGFGDNRTPDCDNAGMWIGQIKAEDGHWQDFTSPYESRDEAMQELMEA